MAYRHIEPIIGAQAIATTSTTQATAHDLGEIRKAVDATLGTSEFMYVQASAALLAFDTVWIKEDYEAAKITEALSKTGGRPGFPQVAFAVDEFGWVQLQGKMQVRVAGDCDSAVALYITASAGVLDDATTSQMIQGLTLISSATGTVSAVSAVASYPTVLRATVPAGS